MKNSEKQPHTSSLLPYLREGFVEAGCDEAGRGCLAGPVVAAAVILPPLSANNPLFNNPLLTDSKQLSARQREQLRPLIMEHALAYGIASVSPQEIDQINILNASILAMHLALAKAEEMLLEKYQKGLITRQLQLQHIIVDGNKFKPYKRQIPHTTIVKGDSKYISIAAASILAKTERDHLMQQLAKEFPQYGWERNMAYPTKDHRDAIAKYGPTPHHRLTFKLLPDPALF